MRSKLTLICILVGCGALWLSALSEDQSTVTPTSTYTDAPTVPRESDQPSESALGEETRTPTQLEPGLAAIEEQFRARMSALRSEMTTATTPEAKQALQEQASQLKVEWTLALANRQLELARARGDTETEAELLRAIASIMNPPARVLKQVPRDAATGEEIKGGAR